MARKPTSLGDLNKGLRVLVTAGASGIGRAIAEVMQNSGARVHVCDVSEKALTKLARARPKPFSSQPPASRVTSGPRSTLRPFAQG